MLKHDRLPLPLLSIWRRRYACQTRVGMGTSAAAAVMSSLCVNVHRNMAHPLLSSPLLSSLLFPRVHIPACQFSPIFVADYATDRDRCSPRGDCFPLPLSLSHKKTVIIDPLRRDLSHWPSFAPLLANKNNHLMQLAARPNYMGDLGQQTNMGER